MEDLVPERRLEEWIGRDRGGGILFCLLGLNLMLPPARMTKRGKGEKRQGAERRTEPARNSNPGGVHGVHIFVRFLILSHHRLNSFSGAPIAS